MKDPATLAILALIAALVWLAIRVAKVIDATLDAKKEAEDAL